MADLSEEDGALGHPVQYAFQVQEAAVALYVKLVKHLGGVQGQVLPQGLLAVQAAQDVLLNVAYDVRFAEVVQAQSAETCRKKKKG